MKNVLILCIDSLRFDRFERHLKFGRSRVSAALESSGARFSNAYTTAPWTYPATNSLLTGLYPHHHGARHEGPYRLGVDAPWPDRLDASRPTVFSLFRDHGYSTLGISTIYWALNERCKYDGCTTLIRSAEQNVFYRRTPARWVVDTFLECYDARLRGTRFLAYLHFMDLHRPLDIGRAQAYSRDRLDAVPGIDEWDTQAYRDTPDQMALFRASKLKAYAALLAYVDDEIGRLIAELKAASVYDDTVVIIVGDHGEEFWDHEEFERRHYSCGKKSSNEWLLGTGHGHTLFQELVHIPLIVLNPPSPISQDAARQNVSIVDVLPSLERWLGAPADMRTDGRPLFEVASDRPLLMEATLYGHERKALIQDNLKCIYAPGDGNCVQFDVAVDPSESNPLPEDTTQHLRSALDALF